MIYSQDWSRTVLANSSNREALPIRRRDPQYTGTWLSGRAPVYEASDKSSMPGRVPAELANLNVLQTYSCHSMILMQQLLFSVHQK